MVLVAKNKSMLLDVNSENTAITEAIVRIAHNNAFIYHGMRNLRNSMVQTLSDESCLVAGALRFCKAAPCRKYGRSLTQMDIPSDIDTHLALNNGVFMEGPVL
jgi:hypothetical protein